MKNINLEKYREYLLNMKGSGKISDKIVPKRVEVECTLQCNLDCIMCDKGKTCPKDVSEELNTGELFSLIDQIEEICAEEITLTGGEPFLRKDILKIIEYIGSKNLKGSVFTNGTLLDKKKLEILCKNNFHIIFSLDGSNAETHEKIRKVRGCFEKTMNNIKLALEMTQHLGGSVSLFNVLQGANIKDMANYSRLAENMGLDAYMEICGGDFGKDNEIMTKQDVLSLKKFVSDYLKGFYKQTALIEYKWDFLRSIINGYIDEQDLVSGGYAEKLFGLERVPCFNGCDYIYVNYKGGVFPCCYHELDDAPLGDIRNESLKDIWYGRKYNEFRKNTTPVDIKNKKLNRLCRDCDHYFRFLELKKKLNQKDYESIKPRNETFNARINKDAMIYLNFSCNNSCKICHVDMQLRNDLKNKNNGNNKIGSLSTGDIKNLIKFNKDIYTGGIVFKGKEPTIRKDFIELVKYAKSRGFEKISVESNGRIFSYRDFCRKAEIAGLTEVTIYIFGKNSRQHDRFTRVPGSFLQAKKGIENLRKTSIKTNVKEL